MDRCCTSLSVCSPPSSLSPAVLLPSLPVGSLYPSIHISPSLYFHPSLLVWPTAPFRFAQGKECCVCVAWQHARSHRPPTSTTSHPSLFSLFPPSSLACSSFPYHRFCFSSLPPSVDPSPPTSFCPRHSLHLLLITPLHLFHSLPPFILRLSPSLPPSSLPRLGSGAVNRCCLLLIWVRSD